MNQNRILLLATTAGLLLGSAAGFGQVTQALHGAVNATAALPPPPTLPPTSIGAAAGATAAAGAATGMAGMNGAVGAAAVTPSMPQVQAGAAVDVHTSVPGVTVTAGEDADAWAALDFDGTMRRLNAVTLDARAAACDDLDARVKASDKALVELGRRSKTFSAESRADFDVAVKDAHAKEKALRRSEKEVRRADAEHWADARADVSARYSAYAQAVHHAQMTAVAASSTKAGAAADRGHDDVRGAASAGARADGSAAAGR